MCVEPTDRTSANTCHPLTNFTPTLPKLGSISTPCLSHNAPHLSRLDLAPRSQPINKGKSNWLSTVFEAIGEDSASESYVLPTQGDAWDFLGGIATWVRNASRKGVPDKRQMSRGPRVESCPRHKFAHKSITPQSDESQTAYLSPFHPARNPDHNAPAN